MKRLLPVLLALLLVPSLSAAQGHGRGEPNPDIYHPKKVDFRAPDRIKIAARLYESDLGKSAPVLVYFHDSSSSKDEYKHIARRLRGRGYNGLAVDLRAGNSANGPKSETAVNALTRTKDRSILDAEMDMASALEWVHRRFPKSRVVGMGCSYSAGLLLRISATRPELLDAAVLFSPAEVFESCGQSATFLRELASRTSCPVFISSARAEESEWRPIFEALPEGLGSAFLPRGSGVHGARALEPKQSASKEVWPALLRFLTGVAPLPARETQEDAGGAPADAKNAKDTGNPGEGTGGKAAGKSAGADGVVEAKPPAAFPIPAGVVDASASTAEAGPSKALAHIVAIGASMTDGMGLPLHLSDVFSTLVRVEHGPIENQGSTFFFMDPKAAGEVAVEVALQKEPTLVVAIDFLFWFGYGSAGVTDQPIAGVEDRLALLEHGFVLLDRFPCPILVGDFPDMKESVGKMLTPAQMPTPEELEALNARLAEWAGARERVILVPLARFAREMHSGKAIRIGGARFPEHSRSRLLQWDDLHPTLEALCAIVGWMGSALVEHGVAREDELLLDFNALFAAARERAAG